MNESNNFKMPYSITSCYTDINFLLVLFSKINLKDITYYLDFKETHFFAAELYNFYHYNINLLRTNGFDICCLNISKNIDYAMHLSDDYLNSNIPKYYTSIKHINFFEELENNNLNCFEEYINKEFEAKSDLNKTAIEYIRLYLSELFVNSRTHGKTNHIYCSGQKYPLKDTIKFTLMDNGVTIPYNVENHIINDKSKYFHNNDGEAIRWSTTEGNTTKSTLGGLGLNDVITFISENNGSIKIFSRNGFYINKKGTTSISKLDNTFNGTLTIIELKISLLNNKKIVQNKNTLDF